MELEDVLWICKAAFAIGFGVAFGAMFCAALVDFFSRVIGGRK
jgi:hypothetical protein